MAQRNLYAIWWCEYTYITSGGPLRGFAIIAWDLGIHTYGSGDSPHGNDNKDSFKMTETLHLHTDNSWQNAYMEKKTASIETQYNDKPFIHFAIYTSRTFTNL